jgi:hypothetical protein
VFAVFSVVLIPVSIFWMVFGRALLAGSLVRIKADHLYKGSAMLLLMHVANDLSFLLGRH